MEVFLDDVFHFDAITTDPTTGAAADATGTPTFEVFENATDTDIGIGGSLTKRTSKTGDYRGSFTASAANGFEAGKFYSVVASATVGGVAGKAVVARFRVKPIEVAQTGDAYVRLGAPVGASISADIAAKATQASVDLKASQASVDDLPTNSELGTALASAVAPLLTSADFTSGLAALMLSASRRVTLGTGLAYEVPDSGTAAYFIELRTFDEDGAPVAADSTPTLSATGGASGDLSAKLSSATNPATGVYRWTYTVDAADPVEPVRLDASATIDGDTFTVPAFPVVTNAVAVDFTSSDRTTLNAIATNAASGVTKIDAVKVVVDALAVSLTTITNRIGAFAGTGVNTILGFFQAIARTNATTPSDMGGAFDPAQHSLQKLRTEIDAVEGGGGTGLTGPYVLTVTVTDADTTDPIEGARVRVWLNSDTESLDTNGDGEAIYAIGDAEAWNIAIDRYGYGSYVGTFEVDGDHVDLPIELTANPSLPAPAAGKAIGYIDCYDEAGELLPGAEVTVVAIRPPGESSVGGTGAAPGSGRWTVTSNSEGRAIFGPTLARPTAGLLGKWEYRIEGEGTGVSEDEKAVFIVPAEAVGDPEGFPIRSFIRRVDS